MPEWVYALGWLAVPALAVVASLWWHERQAGADAQEQLAELRKAHAEALIMNSQLRRELSSLGREYGNLRHVLVGWPAPKGEQHAVVQPNE